MIKIVHVLVHVPLACASVCACVRACMNTYISLICFFNFVSNKFLIYSVNLDRTACQTSDANIYCVGECVMLIRTLILLFCMQEPMLSSHTMRHWFSSG